MKNKLATGLYATIDIGTTSVKAIVVEVNENSKRLLSAESEALNPIDAYASEEDYNQQIRETIAKLAKRLELSKCKTIASLFYNRELQVKLIDFPSQVKLEQLNSIIPWEAKKLLSTHYKEEEFSFAYNVIREAPLSVALAVIPIPLLEAHLKLFEGTGIKPNAVYTDVFAAQALQPIVDIAGLPALSIVNFGYTGTHLHIFSAGRLKFYRYIPSGTSEMANPPREGELEMYSQKIRFSFDYFRAVTKLTQVDNLYFMGGGSANPDFLPYEQNYFSPTKVYPVDISSDMDISPILTSNELTSISTENSTKVLPFIPAIGACLAGLKENAPQMNLMTKLILQEKAKHLDYLSKSLPIMLGLIALAISIGYLYFQYANKQDTLGNLIAELKAVEQNITNKASVLAQKKPKEPEHKINLCQASFKYVEPIIASKHNLNNLFIMIMRLREKGMLITDLLIRNKEEAEQISLSNESEGNNDTFEYSNTEEDKLAPFTSKLSLAMSEQQLKEDFDGKVAIIRGLADNQNQISRFSEGLSSNPRDKNENILPRVIKRYINITTKKTKNNKIEFLLKGELR